jgi:hypothetical protein
MPLNKLALDRIRESKITGDSLAKLFELLSQAPAPPGATLSFNLGWQQPDDPIVEGDLLPTLTFTLHAPVAIQAINASSSGPTVADAHATA